MIWNNRNSHSIIMKANHAITLENCSNFILRLNMCISCDPAIVLVGKYIRKKPTYVQQKTGMRATDFGESPCYRS